MPVVWVRLLRQTFRQAKRDSRPRFALFAYLDSRFRFGGLDDIELASHMWASVWEGPPRDQSTELKDALKP